MGCWEGTVGDRGAGGELLGKGEGVRGGKNCGEMGEGTGSMEGTVGGRDGRRGMRGTR